MSNYFTNFLFCFVPFFSQQTNKNFNKKKLANFSFKKTKKKRCYKKKVIKKYN